MDPTSSSSTASGASTATTIPAVSLHPRARASSHSPAAIRRSAALTATLAAPCPFAILLHLDRYPRHVAPLLLLLLPPLLQPVLQPSVRGESFLFPLPPSLHVDRLPLSTSDSPSALLFLLYLPSSSSVSSSFSSSSSSPWLSRRIDRMLPHTRHGFFRKKTQLHCSFMGVRWLRTPSANTVQLARLWHACFVFFSMS